MPKINQIIIKIIPDTKQRIKGSLGDYWLEGDTLQVRVSQFPFAAKKRIIASCISFNSFCGLLSIKYLQKIEGLFSACLLRTVKFLRLLKAQVLDIKNPFSISNLSIA
jgi:hypothetical protein